MTPVAVGAAPAARKKTEQEFLDLRGGAIAQRRQIGNQTSVPKQNGHGKIGRDCEYVPHQRTAEIWPDAESVWQRREVPRHPDTTNVHARKNRGAHDRKKRHRFGGAIDRGAPFLMKQVQDGGDERPGVPDTDPENEVGDVPGPANRMIQSPGTDAGGNLVTETEHTEHRDRSGDGEANPPPARCWILDHTGNPRRQPTEPARRNTT